jgi:hypothetical protein
VPFVVVAGAGVVTGITPGVVTVPVLVVVAGVEVVPVPVVPGDPVPTAVPAGWLVTNWVNAASSAVNKVPPPP